MKIESLSLLQYGPFLGKELRFDPSCELHVIFGPNEAGKSTSLRALQGWLFGIEKASDSWATGDPKNLRARGVLPTFLDPKRRFRDLAHAFDKPSVRIVG